MLPALQSLPPAFEWIPVANSVVLFAMIAGALIKYSTWRATEEKRKREAEQQQKELISSVCTEFTHSAAYRDARDQRTREIASVTVHEAFAQRASSFVDSKVYEAEMRALRADLQRMSDDIKDNTSALRSVSDRMGGMVFRDPPKNG